MVPHGGQHAAKCIPKWQPTRRLAVSCVGWGDNGFEPRTAGQQSGALQLSHHAFILGGPIDVQTDWVAQ
jgi:hypothetical protein